MPTEDDREWLLISLLSISATTASGTRALTSLALSDNDIGLAGARAIASLASLTSLDLRGNDIGAAGARAIASLSLTSLDLSSNEIEDQGARELLDHWTSADAPLRYLWLHDNGTTPRRSSPPIVRPGACSYVQPRIRRSRQLARKRRGR